MKILDKKDKKILYYLSLNARESDTQLSKLVGLSKNTIKYRIARLKEKGIIKQFASVINLGVLHFDTITIFIKFNEDISKRLDLVDYFINHDFVDWLVILSGQWDLFVEFIIKDLSCLQEIIKAITSHFGDLLNSYKVSFSSTILRVEHLIRDFYKDLDVELLPLRKRSFEGYQLDLTDKKILHLLNQDSTLSYIDLSRRLNASTDVIRYRMRMLIEKGIIIKFFPEVSLKRLGYTEYLYSLKIKNTSQEKLNQLKKHISTNAHITYAYVDLLSFNLVFVCAFTTADGIDELSRSLRRDYGTIIDNEEYFIIKEQLVFNLFPQGLVN